MFWDTFPIMLIMHFHKIRRLCTSKSNYANQVLILKPQKVWRRENNVWRVKFLLLHNCILLSEWQDVWENNVLQKQYFDIWRQSAVCPSEQRLWCLATTSQGNHLTSTWIITDGEGRMEKPKKYHHHHYHHQLTITGNNLRHSTVQSTDLKTLTSHHLTMALSEQGGKNV